MVLNLNSHGNLPGLLLALARKRISAARWQARLQLIDLLETAYFTAESLPENVTHAARSTAADKTDSTHSWRMLASSHRVPQYRVQSPCTCIARALLAVARVTKEINPCKVPLHLVVRGRMRPAGLRPKYDASTRERPNLNTPTALETMNASERLGHIDIILRVVAMAVKGVARENHEEDAYAISNMVMDICDECKNIRSQLNSL